MSVLVKVYDKALTCITLQAEQDDNLMQILGANGIYFPANCGGKGRCRRCEVLVDGRKRKACNYWIAKDCKIYVPFVFQNQMDTVLAKDCASQENQNNKQNMGRKDVKTDSFRLVVDVGTTTIGVALIDSNGTIVKQAGVANSQIAYGADVASRIVYASDEAGLSRLKKYLYQDIENVFADILKECKLDAKKVSDIYLTGNTVMLNIANGISPKNIGSYPFTPLECGASTHREILWNKMIYPVHTFACASGYIGSDVLLGAYYYKLHSTKDTVLYIDLGTNGEMILAYRKQLYSASVAAGPAFEQLMHGSELIKLLVNLLDSKKMDQHGTLREPYFSEGIICKQIKITQEDVRQIQLAKAAVRAGIQIMCNRAGCQLDGIDKIYVAGGFGFYLNMNDAYRIKMLPECFKDKNVETIGNASLQAAISLYETAGLYDSYTAHICNMDLSLDENFMTEYMKYIDF